MIQPREKEALSAYLKLLQAKGATTALLYQRSQFLEKLCIGLADKELYGESYRYAVEACMENVAKNEWHQDLIAAREFYHFWVKDIKAIAAINLTQGFDVQPLQWKPDEASLKSLTDSLENEKFDTSENWPLKAYAKALRDEDAEQSVIDTRIKLAKLLLIRLRSAPEKNGKTYRAAVDHTLPLFNIKQNRRLFLVVIREFFHFWSGNPDAQNMVLKDGSGNMLI